MAYQLVWDYFMPKGRGMSYIVHLYLHIYVKFFFFAHGCMISGVPI